MPRTARATSACSSARFTHAPCTWRRGPLPVASSAVDQIVAQAPVPPATTVALCLDAGPEDRADR